MGGSALCLIKNEQTSPFKVDPKSMCRLQSAISANLGLLFMVGSRQHSES